MIVAYYQQRRRRFRTRKSAVVQRFERNHHQNVKLVYHEYLIVIFFSRKSNRCYGYHRQSMTASTASIYRTMKEWLTCMMCHRLCRGRREGLRWGFDSAWDLVSCGLCACDWLIHRQEFMRWMRKVMVVWLKSVNGQYGTQFWALASKFVVTYPSCQHFLIRLTLAPSTIACVRTYMSL